MLTLLLNMLPQHLLLGQQLQLFLQLKKVSQLAVKECILNSAPKSFELLPIPSKLSIEYLDYILNSLTDPCNSFLHLASSHSASNQPLSHLFSKRGLDHSNSNNYRPVSIHALLLKYWKSFIITSSRLRH